ncbi:MAG: hypothetical protein ACW967_09500 [Candidatus Hodarchaeales archaeon]|jgi:hypothetical protein
MKISADNYWYILEKFLGEWTGEISGKAGNGTGYSKYERRLHSKFIYYKNRVEFPPQKDNPDGEIHEDAGYFSYDTFNETGLLRVFYGEGYVSKYDLINYDKKNSHIIFEATENENLPSGYRTKLTLDSSSESSFSEKFEIASPGQNYNKCIINRRLKK